MRLLAELLAGLSGKKRQKVMVGLDFEWSESRVYNFFRTLELIFWRKSGVRPEMTSNSDSVMQFHTLESALVYLEYSLRNFRLPVRVWIPLLSNPVGLPLPASPYLFAIAFDAVANSAENTTANHTWNHTITGSNTLLLGWGTDENHTVDPYTLFTYNSVAMVDAVSQASTTRFLKLLALANPTTGLNTVSATVSGGANHQEATTSYSGCNQSSTLNATGTGTALAVLSVSASVTPTVANCWAVSAAINEAAGISAGTGSTSRTGGLSAPLNAGDSNATITNGSPYSMQWTAATSGLSWAEVIAAIAPPTVATTTNFLTLLGAGS